jgi:hypothetical protein
MSVPQYQRFTVPLNPALPFSENFRQVGIALRKQLAQELKTSPNLWTQFQSQNSVNVDRADKVQCAGGAVTDLSNAEAWADIWTIRYAAWRLKLNILFVNPSSTQEPVYCGVENFTNGKTTLFVYWSNRMHFEPIVQKNGCEIVRLFGQNHAFLQCLRTQYKQACPIDPIGK